MVKEPAAFPGYAGEGQCDTGMTLRDYFAAVALPIVAKDWGTKQDDDDDASSTFLSPREYGDIAEDAYALADAMMKARKP